jgi:hypothetical protein
VRARFDTPFHALGESRHADDCTRAPRRKAIRLTAEALDDKTLPFVNKRWPRGHWGRASAAPGAAQPARALAPRGGGRHLRAAVRGGGAARALRRARRAPGPRARRLARLARARPGRAAHAPGGAPRRRAGGAERPARRAGAGAGRARSPWPPPRKRGRPRRTPPQPTAKHGA